MTLPEVLIAMVVMGMLVLVITSAIQVVLVGNGSSQGRALASRDQQILTAFIPNDLASASDVSTDAGASPCPDVCDPAPTVSGSNALLLTWQTGYNPVDGSSAGTTRVSYQAVRSSDDPNLFELYRIICTSSGSTWACSELLLLEGLSGPPGGEEFIAGVTVPSWILQVSAPLAAAAINNTQLATAAELKDAKRVIVTINRGTIFADVVGESRQLSITAGGTSRGTIDPGAVTRGPTFTNARSRCGGPIALIVDDSGSIGTDMPLVRQGVSAFIDGFAGTPTELQVVRFDTTAGVLGAGSNWSRYFDLSDEAEVAELKGYLGALQAGGGTNWEDAWFRAIYEPDGTLQSTLPEMIVFMTDGRQTLERLRYRAAPGQIIPNSPPLPGPGWPMFGSYYSNGSAFTQVGFNRTDWIVDQVRSTTRIIGVGVGGITTTSSPWVDQPGAGYHLEYERGYREYQKLLSGTWVWINAAEYSAGNQAADSSDGYRQVTKQYVTVDADAMDWEPTSEVRTDGGYRSVKVYSEPYELTDDPISVNTSDMVILSRLITGGDYAVQANWNAAEQVYDNALTAELYLLNGFNEFAQALVAVALDECGGTLSTRARIDGASSVPTGSILDGLSFQNSSATTLNGTPVAIEPTVVSVSSDFPVGTFDFDIPGAASLLVDVYPVDGPSLSGYQQNQTTPWTCRAGGSPRSFTPLAVEGFAWVGARVEVGANEAVSCTLELSTP